MIQMLYASKRPGWSENLQPHMLLDSYGLSIDANLVREVGLLSLFVRVLTFWLIIVVNLHRCLPFWDHLGLGEPSVMCTCPHLVVFPVAD